MSIKDNTALVIRYVQKVLNEGRIDSHRSDMRPDLIIHLPQFPEMAKLLQSSIEHPNPSAKLEALEKKLLEQTKQDT